MLSLFRRSSHSRWSNKEKRSPSETDLDIKAAGRSLHAGEIDRKWSEEIDADFAKWRDNQE